jgi:plastocyanin
MAIHRALLPLAAAAALVACSAPAALAAASAPGAEPAGVRITQYRFEPPTLEIARGATVRWVNDDDDPHTVTADAGAFGSAGIDTHEEFVFTFPAAGTYAYHCALHPMMQGTVVVR